MSDIRILFSETVDTGIYAYRLFPAIGGILAAMALYPRVRARVASLPPSLLANLSRLAIPAAGIPGLVLIVLRIASISTGLNPYLSVAGVLLLAIGLIAAVAGRRIGKDPASAAAAVLSGVAGAAVFLLSMLLMLGLLQVPRYKDPMLSLLGILLPVALTFAIGGWPVVQRVLSTRGRAAQIAGSLAAGAGFAVLAFIFLLITGIPAQLPRVAVIPMTAFPLAALAGLKAADHVSIRLYSLLLALRMVIVVGLVAFLARPMLHIQSQQAEKRKLVFAIDASASMSARDGANVPTRIDWVKQALSYRYLDRLKKDFDLAFFSFSSGADELKQDQLPGLKAEGKTTNIAEAIGRVKPAFPDADIASVVLVSDGIDNSGGPDPVKPIVEQGVIVNTIGVGALSDEKERIKDIAVKHVECPRYATVNNATEIKAYVESTGIVGQVTVLLKKDGKELTQSKIFLESTTKTQIVPLKFTPDTVGHFEFEVSVPPEPEERIQQNNTYPFSLIVTDPKIKVLYLEGAPRSEYKFLKRTLDMDPNIELLSLVQTRKDIFLKQGSTASTDVEIFPTDIETLRKFDVIILGDVDVTLFSRKQLEMIEQVVKDKAGFLMMGGQSSFGPGGYAGTPVADLLPVEIGGRGDKQFSDPFMLKLADEGKVHPIFQGTVEFFDGRDKTSVLPDLAGCTEVLSAKPAAVVLAVDPDKIAHDGKPLIVAAVQQYGTGRTMAFTADTTWRWFFQMRSLGRETPYVKFWGQTVRWLANQEVKEREQKPGITVFTDKRSYEPGETVRMFARARGEGGLASNDAIIHAIIDTPAGSQTPVQLAYVPGTTGEYEGTFDPPAPGKYDVSVTGMLNQQPLGEKIALDFRVGSPNLEFDQLDLNEPLLKRIAAETGGRYYSLILLDDLIKNLQTSEQQKRTQRQVSLWDAIVMPVVNLTRPIGFIHNSLSFLAREPQGMFFAFLVLVTVEWTIRKRRMLS
ncbi:MAG TPA: glutamine amidotransferase [Planctomycetota bacterium]|nr:glutamine amidotransferase [Planctomycetota bacterium]